MADASFDVVVIGGGQHGLVASNYLALNGMSVGLFERAQEVGGPAASRSSPLPGFIANPHAEYLGFWNSPCNQDFRLHEKGLEFIFPEVQVAMAYPDERCLVIYTAIEWDKETGAIAPRPDIVERNVREVARISSKDAETMAKLAQKRFWDWFTAIFQHLYSPPALPSELDPIELLLNDPESGLERRYEFMTEMEVVCDLFESPEVRTLALAWNLYNGVFPDDVVPIPMALLWMSSLFGVAGMALAKGGTHNVAHALQRALSEQGGEFFVGADVEQVLVEHGRARGIRLADGAQIEARKLVVDAADITQIINRHLRDVVINPDIRRKVNNLRNDRGQYFWGHAALHEAPQYKATGWNPDFGRARWPLMGEPDLEYLYREYRYRAQHKRPGQWPPKDYISASIDSQWDPSYAPPGKHLAHVGGGLAPPASWLSEREWVKLKREAGDCVLAEWRKYAPNMTPDNVIAINIGCPYEHQLTNISWVDGNVNSSPAPLANQWGKLRPIPELAQYQVPGIENLWLASGSCHHGVGLLGAAGYNCYKRMAQKLGLRKPWEEQGRLI